MNVLLPPALEEFVSNQVRAGEFDDARGVVCEALRLLREERESREIEKMRSAFAGVDNAAGKGQPTRRDRALVGKLLASHRSGKRRARRSFLTQMSSSRPSFGPAARRDEP